MSIQFESDGTIKFPNIKRIFLPDEGKEICDADLSGADIMVVAADSQCKWLLDFFSKPQPKKVYAHIASEFFQRDISDKSSEYKLYKGVFHGVNYLMGVDKLAIVAGIPINLARNLKEFYFRLNPEINLWHQKLETDVRKKGYVTNKFGRKLEFLKLDNPNLMNEVCASIPQSTIGDVINKAWVKIKKIHPNIDVLMQTHDSLTMQYDINKAPFYREEIKKLMVVDIPYNPILRIPSDIKYSKLSYGDCK